MGFTPCTLDFRPLLMPGVHESVIAAQAGNQTHNHQPKPSPTRFMSDKAFKKKV